MPLHKKGNIMRNKRFLAVLCLILCMVLVLGLAACGSNKDDGDKNNSGNNDNKGNNDNPTIEKVTVTFMNGETVVDTIEINKGTAVAATTKTVTAPEGKQFKSWQKDGADYDFTAKVNGNITLVATFEDIPAPAPTTFTITFKDADGNVLTTFQVEKDNYINADDVPTAPDRTAEHMTFVKWVRADDDTLALDLDWEVNESVTYVPVYEMNKYTVTIKNGADDSIIETRTIEHGKTVGEIKVTGYRVAAVKNGDADYDLTAPVTSDLTLTVTLEELKFKVTFQDAEGNKLGEAEVLDGGDVVMPAPADGTYWTATAAEYAKMFNVRADVTVVLGTTDATAYRNQETWLTWDGGVNDTIEKFGADYTHWTKNGNGTYNCPQGDGNYFTLTGDFARLTFNLFAGAGDSGYYDIYVDDILVRKLEFDNSDGTGNKQQWVVALEKTMIPAGQHTIKVVAHSKTQITAINPWYAVRKDNYDVSFKNGDEEISKVSVPAGTAVAKPADPTPGANQEFLYWSLDGETEYDFTQPVNSDITLKAVFRFLETYDVTFKRADGTEITKVTVGRGLNVAMPALPDASNYWTATAAEYAKMFNVTEDREVTLDVVARSSYKNLGAGTFSIANEANINTVKGWGFDFTNWKIQDTDGNYGVYEQENGAKITITANLCKVAFATQVEAGKTCTYKIYIDGQLHSSVTVDNSTGTAVKKANGYDVFCQPESFPAGEHTVVIEIEGAGTIHAATIVQYVAPTT